MRGWRYARKGTVIRTAQLPSGGTSEQKESPAENGGTITEREKHLSVSGEVDNKRTVFDRGERVDGTSETLLQVMAQVARGTGSGDMVRTVKYRIGSTEDTFGEQIRNQ